MLAFGTVVGEAPSSILRASRLLVRLLDTVGVSSVPFLDTPIASGNAAENASCSGRDIRTGNAAEGSTEIGQSSFLRHSSFAGAVQPFSSFDGRTKGTWPKSMHCRSMHSGGSSEGSITQALNLRQIFEGLASDESKVDSESETQRPAEVEEETASTSSDQKPIEQKVLRQKTNRQSIGSPTRSDGSPRNFAQEQIAQVSIVAKAFEPEMVEHFRDSVLAVWEQEGEENAEAPSSGEVQQQESSANQPWVRPQKGAVSLPVHKRRFTVLRSPHIDKKSREQFEINVHKRLIKIPVTMHELPLLVDWLKENAFIGVQLTVTVNYQTPLYAPQ